MREPTDKAVAAAKRIFAAHAGVMTTGEAREAGIHTRTLYWMRDHGTVEVLSRGVFALTSALLPRNPDVVAVMRRVPKAVLCLVSALDYHGIGTQIPATVQIALPRSVRPPKIDHPRIQSFNMSEAAYGAGVEEHSMSGTPVRVFCVAKTVADCFKYRNRIGLDIAIEALQESIRHTTVAPYQIMHYARIDRVETVIDPYLTALL